MTRADFENNYDWYVLSTLYGREDEIKSFIEYHIDGDKNYLIKNPKKKIPEWKNGEFRESIKQVFSGYLFILVSKEVNAEDLLTEILSFKKYDIGIVKLLHFSDKPVPAKLTSAEIKKITILLNNDDIVDYTIGLKNGDEVIIISGPLKEHIAKIEKIDTRKFKIKVSFNFLGFQTVDLPFTFVEKII